MKKAYKNYRHNNNNQSNLNRLEPIPEEHKDSTYWGGSRQYTSRLEASPAPMGYTSGSAEGVLFMYIKECSLKKK